MPDTPTRRKVLGTIGAGAALTVAGCIDNIDLDAVEDIGGNGDPDGNDTDNNGDGDGDGNGPGDGEYSDGFVVFMYDSGPRTDYTKAFPVHQEYGVPGCTAVLPGLMGRQRRWLHPDQLGEMYDAGWEVMSMSLEHRALGEIPVRSDISRGDSEIHVQDNIHGQYEDDPLVIYNDDNRTQVTSAGRTEQNDQEYLQIQGSIEQDFGSGDGFETWVRYTDDFTEQVLQESKQTIEDWGYGPVTGYVHPYDRYDGYVSEVVDEYYDAVLNRVDTGLHPTFEPNPLFLGRRSFEDNSMSDEELESFMDAIQSEPDFGILYGETTIESFTQERIETAIGMAVDRDIPVITLQEALDLPADE